MFQFFREMNCGRILENFAVHIAESLLMYSIDKMRESNLVDTSRLRSVVMKFLFRLPVHQRAL